MVYTIRLIVFLIALLFPSMQQCMSRSLQRATRGKIAKQLALDRAVQTFDIPAMSRALRAGANPNMINAEGSAPLIYCLTRELGSKGRLEAIRLLLQYKADPDLPIRSERQAPHLGLYPIHITICKKDQKGLDLLLEYKAKVNVYTRENCEYFDFSHVSPLLCACTPRYKIDPDVVGKLLKAGAYTTARLSDSLYTPLHLATLDKNILNIAHLVRAGADRHAPDALGFSPLHYAVITNDVCTLWAIARDVDINVRIRHHDEQAQAYLSAKLRQKNSVESLLQLEQSMKPYSLMYADFTPLHFACNLSKNNDMFDQLLALHADVNAVGYLGVTPLHAAIIQGSSSESIELCVDRVKKLCAAGANPLAWALLVAFEKSRYASPLLLAMSLDEPEVFNVLYDHILENRLRIDDGKHNYIRTALSHEKLSDDDCIALLEKLFAIGADAASVDRDGYSALHIAVLLNKSPRIIRYLIDRGAPVVCLSEERFTPYEFALMAKNNTLIDLLKPYIEAAHASVYVQDESLSIEPLATFSPELLDPRIGNIDCLVECGRIFSEVPGFDQIRRIICRFGSKETLATYSNERQQFGAINNAKGAAFEVEAAYRLLLEQQLILNFRVHYGRLEYDIETPSSLVECKHIAWHGYRFEHARGLKAFFICHKQGAQKLGKNFLVYSYNKVPDDWAAWFKEQGIAFRVHQPIIAVA